MNGGRGRVSKRADQREVGHTLGAVKDTGFYFVWNDKPLKDAEQKSNMI